MPDMYPVLVLNLARCITREWKRTLILHFVLFIPLLGAELSTSNAAAVMEIKTSSVILRQ